MQTQVVFFGGSQYVLPILDALSLALVVTTEKNPTDPVINFCKEKNIPYLSVYTLADAAVKQRLHETVTDVAVLADFGLIIPHDILTLYPKGIVNIHPSLLPKYRGQTPGHSAIIHGDTETGVSLIKLDDQVDHGPIIAQQKKELPSYYTAEDLYKDLFAEGAKLLSTHLEKYINGEIQPKEQQHDEATYTPKLTRESGYFDINTPPNPEQLERMVRAYYPWPGVWTTIRIRNKEVRIKLFPQMRIQAEGGKIISIRDFLNGYPELKPVLQELLVISY
jgi:methionyl-tRNA formyltransferase